jgi:hypothetical protein
MQPTTDANDILREQGVDYLRLAFDRASRHHNVKGRFHLEPFDAIKLASEPSYLVKGIIPPGGLTVAWGPPKCGKSFWIFDLMMHVALGWQYRGRRVQQGAVVYLALEGGHGFRARIEAWRRRHLAEHHEPVPFYLISVSVDLVKDHGALIAAISDQLDLVTPSAVVIDTLNRALSGDENKPDDMGKFIHAADVIREAFGCAAIVVHHCGVEGTRPRGHTSLAGAVDAQIAVTRDAAQNVVAKVELMKDGPEGAIVVSKLEPIELGTDADGDPITSCIIVPVEGEAAKQKPRLSPTAVAALRALNECLADSGTPAPASPHVPVGVTCVTLAIWRENLAKLSVINRDGGYREQFRRLRVTLKNAGVIGIWDEIVWTVT